MTGNGTGNGARITLAVALTFSTAMAASACGSGSAAPAANGPVTISVGCEPPTSEPTARQNWVADVDAFEKLNPKVTVNGDDTNPCDDPATFDAKLAGGQMDNVFYTYFTDGANVIDSGQAADIQSYAGQITDAGDIQQSLMNVYRKGDTAAGDLYGIFCLCQLQRPFRIYFHRRVCRPVHHVLPALQ